VTVADSVFCRKCLENQRLFTASLAQYFPEDPDSPDYAEAEREYYKFRRGLESRYPQICQDCEPRVLERVRQAAYTARTDHLRRMIDRSQEVRQARTLSGLDIVSAVGQAAWISALVLQLVWHAVVVQRILAAQVVDGRAVHWYQTAALTAESASPRWLTEDGLGRWSIILAASSAWWNPFLTQTVRGFTRHIVGLSTWYTYQTMLVLLVLLAPRLLNNASDLEKQSAPLIGGHLFMALFAALAYVLAGRSIRIDTAPLFGHETVLNQATPKRAKSPTAAIEMSMSEMLDELVAEPTERATSDELRGTTLPNEAGMRNRRVPTLHRDHAQQLAQPSLDLLTLPENALASARAVARVQQTSDEMDWSPTQSPYRAFNSYRPHTTQNAGFGQAPVEPQNGPIWFKVPPAPISPAERRLKPAAGPIRRSPLAKEDFRFRPARPSNQGLAEASNQELQDDVAFAQPKLFTRSQDKDSRVNKLTDMFDRGFSLATEGQGSAAHVGKTSEEAALSGRKGVQLATILFILFAWLHAELFPHRYSAQVTFTAGVCCLVLSTWSVGAGVHRTKRGHKPTWHSIINSIFAVSEIGLAGLLGLQAWNGSSLELVASQGGWLMGLMVSHHLCSLLI
jgi:hypothetical protein